MSAERLETSAPSTEEHSLAKAYTGFTVAGAAFSAMAIDYVNEPSAPHLQQFRRALDDTSYKFDSVINAAMEESWSDEDAQHILSAALIGNTKERWDSLRTVVSPDYLTDPFTLEFELSDPANAELDRADVGKFYYEKLRDILKSDQRQIESAAWLRLAKRAQKRQNTMNIVAGASVMAAFLWGYCELVMALNKKAK